MRYQAYPEYKDSESRWIDVIPKQWKRMPLKYVVSDRITDGPHETPSFKDDGIPFLSAESVKNNKLDFGRKRGYITNELHEHYSKKCLPRLHDIFMVKSGNTTGALAIVETEEEFNIWSPLALIRADRSKLLPRFVYFSMQADFFKRSVELSWSQGTQPNIGMGVIENLHIATPSKEEQRVIANFLDHETAKIDTLIDKQQQLISLLKEKRQAVISHALTKGLNPDAPMKDSGVEWLGEVPEGWEVTRGKYLFDFVTSGSRGWASYYSEEGSLFFRIANLTRDTIDPKLESIQRVNPPVGSEGERAVIKVNDLLVSITADLGSVCVADKSVAGGYVSQHVSLCRPNGSVKSARWLAYYILSDISKEQLLGAGYGGTKIQLSLEDIRDLLVAEPPASEQISLAEFVDRQMERFDILIDKAERQIKLLQERRTALISAAVTGKIDVRNWQPPTNAEAP